MDGTRALLGDVDVFETDDAYELTHLPTGIQLTYTADGAGISVPYWYTGCRAEEMVRAIHRLGRMVETVTGLASYDPQLDASLSEAATRPDVSAGTFDEVIRNMTKHLGAEPPDS